MESWLHSGESWEGQGRRKASDAVEGSATMQQVVRLRLLQAVTLHLAAGALGPHGPRHRVHELLMNNPFVRRADVRCIATDLTLPLNDAIAGLEACKSLCNLT